MEKVRLQGYMVDHKSMIKWFISKRKFIIHSISAPIQNNYIPEGQCVVFIEGYTTEGHVKMEDHEENKRMFKQYCSTRKEQHRSHRKYKDNRKH